MTKRRKKDANAIARYYGYDNQSEKAIEECAELIQAIVKYKHRPCGIHKMHIVDEIADVEIMLEQLKLLLNCKKAVKNRIIFKLNRQLKRIEKEAK